MTNSFDLALELLAESQASHEEYRDAQDLAIFVEEYGNLISQACEHLISINQKLNKTEAVVQPTLLRPTSSNPQ